MENGENHQFQHFHQFKNLYSHRAPHAFFNIFNDLNLIFNLFTKIKNMKIQIFIEKKKRKKPNRSTFDTKKQRDEIHNTVEFKWFLKISKTRKI